MKVTVAALQTALTDDIATNVARITALVREAAAQGAQIILPSELFEGVYFCQTQREEDFTRARPAADHPTLVHGTARTQKRGFALCRVIAFRNFPTINSNGLGI